MLGHEFLHTAINEQLGAGNELEGCDYLSDTDYITIPADKEFAIVIIEEPFDFQQVASNVNSTKKAEEYIVNVLIKALPDNKLTNENLKGFRDTLQAASEKVVRIIAARSKTYNGVASVAFGKADPGLMSIESRSFYVMPIPVKITAMYKPN